MLQYAAYRTLYNYRLFFNAGLGLRTFFFPLGTPPGKALPALFFLVGMLYYHRYEGDKQQYGSAALLTQYPSYSELLEDYYATKDRAERLRQKSRELYKAVHNMHDRAVRKQAARREELAQSSKADTLRLYGELLQANLWAVHKGDRQVTVQNYYTGEDVTIKLDPRFGPNENAQKYFRL